MEVYSKPGGHLALRGQTIVFPQDIQQLATVLPRLPREVKVLIVRRRAQQQQQHQLPELRVRRRYVEAALKYLIEHHKFYRHKVTLCMDRLSQLPEDGFVEGTVVDVDEHEQLVTKSAASPAAPEQQASNDDLIPHCSGSLIPLLSEAALDSSAIESAIQRAVDCDIPTAHAASSQQVAAATAGGTPARGTAYINMPARGSKPLSEFSTPGLLSMLFPCLFPQGCGDPTDPERPRKVRIKDGVRHLVRFMDPRFANHKRFLFFCYNALLRRSMLSQSSFYLKSHVEDALLSRQELRSMYEQRAQAPLTNRITRFASNLVGTSGWWYRQRLRVQDMIQQHGCPTLFVSMSCADTHWPAMTRLTEELLRDVIKHGDDAGKDKYRIALANPAIVVDYFLARVELYCQEVFGGILSAKYIWRRTEFQHRGSLHVHMFVKLPTEPGPGLVSLSRTALTGYISEQILKHRAGEAAELPISWSAAAVAVEPDLVALMDLSSEELQKWVQDGKHCAQQVIAYADQLVTACNPTVPSPPARSAAVPQPESAPMTTRSGSAHPSDHTFSSVGLGTDQLEHDYEACTNTLERHTQCSLAHCLVQVTERHDGNLVHALRCRLRFPRPIEARTRLKFTQCANGEFDVEVVPRRNDELMTPHHRTLLQLWRANIELQVLVDARRAVKYVTKYAAKSEKRSDLATQIKHAIVDKGLGTDPASVAIRQAFVACANRDVGDQEAYLTLAGHHLAECNMDFSTVDVRGGRRLLVTQDDDDDDMSDAGGQEHEIGDDAKEDHIVVRNAVDVYAARQTAQFTVQFPELKDAGNMNLDTFGRFYRVDGRTGAVKRRVHPETVVVHFAGIPAISPYSDAFPEYCRGALMRYKPWMLRPDELWPHAAAEKREPSSDELVTEWRNFLSSELGQSVVSDWRLRLQDIVHFEQRGLQPQDRALGIHELPGQNEGSDDEADSQEQPWVDMVQPAEGLLAAADDERCLPQGREWLSWQGDTNEEYWSKHELVMADAQKAARILKTVKDAHTKVSETLVRRRNAPVVTREQLNTDQQLVFDVVMHHVHVPSAGQLLLNVEGTSGTGKTYVLRAIADQLGDVVVMTASTGKAATLLGGCTVHTALKLMVGHDTKVLSDAVRQELQLMWRGKKLLVIDEKSMIDQALFAVIDLRARDATGCHHLPFGGLHVLICGDIGQLPPLRSGATSCPLSSDSR